MTQIAAGNSNTGAAPRIPFYRHSIGEREVTAVVECLRSDWITTGPITRQFEQRFAQMIGCAEAVAVSSCTAAMHLALATSGIRAGDEVIVPTLTFVATAEAALYCGATPVLVDCRRDNFTLDVAAVEAALTPRTRAVLPMHYGGHACDLDAIHALARAHDLLVVEDAAHALTGWYKGVRVGSNGNPACFSFHATKPLTTGEGGMVTTNDASLAARIRIARLHGMRRDAFTRDCGPDPWAYDVQGLGYKCNLTDIASALGLAQLDGVEEQDRRRAQIASRYRRALAGRDELILQSISSDVVHGNYLFPVLLRIEMLDVDRDTIMRELLARGVATSVHYRALHLFPDFVTFCRISPQCGENSGWVCQRLITLPLYARLSDADVDLVVQTLIEVIERHRR